MNPLGCTQSPLGTGGPQDKIQCDKLGILGPSKYLNLNLEKRVGLIKMPKRAKIILIRGRNMYKGMEA